MPLHSNVYRKRGEPTNVGCEALSLANRGNLNNCCNNLFKGGDNMGQKSKDLSGQKFGELTAIKIVEKNKNGNVWECKCTCGNITKVLASRLLSGKTKSCGHLKHQHKPRKDLIGKHFGRLTVIEHSNKDKYWICQCECGNIKEIYEYNLLKGKTNSCGCLHKEIVHNALYENLIGNVYGRWKVIGESEKGSQYCKCKCSCGTIKDVFKNSLKNGESTSCGCYKKEVTSQFFSLNLQGQRFGKLTVLQRAGSFVGKDNTKYSTWLCQCDCGNKKIVRGHDLIRGTVSSCGCLISKGEYLVRQILLKNNILFDTQYSFNDLRSNKNYPLKFDFAVFNENRDILCLIEYQGEQHDIEYSKYHIDFGKQQRETTDKQKKEYCIKNKIPFFEIWYYQNIEEEISKILQQLHENPVPSL